MADLPAGRQGNCFAPIFSKPKVLLEYRESSIFKNFAALAQWQSNTFVK